MHKRPNKEEKCWSFNFIAAMRECQIKLNSVLFDLEILYLAIQIASLKFVWLQKYWINDRNAFIPFFLSLGKLNAPSNQEEQI